LANGLRGRQGILRQVSKLHPGVTIGQRE